MVGKSPAAPLNPSVYVIIPCTNVRNPDNLRDHQLNPHCCFFKHTVYRFGHRDLA